MEELLGSSDHVACLASVTLEIENLMLVKTFEQMEPSAFFINLSCGNLVNEKYLIVGRGGR